MNFLLDGRLELVITEAKNGLIPFNYLTYLLEKLPNINLDNPEQLDKLLPIHRKFQITAKARKSNRIENARSSA